MALPKAGIARMFFRAALQRLEDARTLLSANRTTGAVYLAGYAVECAFKALLLSRLGAKEQATMIDSFRGARGHSLESLRDRFQKLSGVRLPNVVANQFSIVMSWNTDLRYETGNVRNKEAVYFLSATEVILTWAKKQV